MDEREKLIEILIEFKYGPGHGIQAIYNQPERDKCADQILALLRPPDTASPTGRSWATEMASVEPCGHTRAQHLYADDKALKLEPCEYTNPPVDPAKVERLKEIRIRLDAATPGPWRERRSAGLPSFVQAPRQNQSDPYDIEVLGEDETLYPTREQDITFVAHSRADIPWLLTELEGFYGLRKE